ncbi:DUF1738 domain-containing protein [Helicobacter saguini]|uniref:ArdC-like ssDNA-binding domain-containing protein n=1 Tax=Helicobacter saguini TaxID=1548018 RepID=UPI000E59F16E|nr:ArdC family protein [Helicobacter saguini]MWV60992.1 DUF1738 domain-containing protein [Helicobacter saguini]
MTTLEKEALDLILISRTRQAEADGKEHQKNSPKLNGNIVFGTFLKEMKGHKAEIANMDFKDAIDLTAQKFSNLGEKFESWADNADDFIHRQMEKGLGYYVNSPYRNQWEGSRDALNNITSGLKIFAIQELQNLKTMDNAKLQEFVNEKKEDLGISNTQTQQNTQAQQPLQQEKQQIHNQIMESKDSRELEQGYLESCKIQVAMTCKARKMFWKQDKTKEQLDREITYNGITGKAYLGANGLIIQMDAARNEYSNPVYLTQKQAQDLCDATLKKNAKGVSIEIQNKQTGETIYPKVYHASQFDNLDTSKLKPKDLGSVEKLRENYNKTPDKIVFKRLEKMGLYENTLKEFQSYLKAQTLGHNFVAEKMQSYNKNYQQNYQQNRQYQPNNQYRNNQYQKNQYQGR